MQQTRRSPLLRLVARLGLLARAVFYGLLAYLAAAVAGGWNRDGRQANANGALAAVAEGGFGRLALLAGAVGFAAFGVMRVAGALGDHSVGRLRRLTTVGQGLFYFAMAATTAMFLIGRRQTGSEQQHQGTTARLLSEPAGRWLVAAIGVAVLSVCLWQVWVAVSQGYTDSLRTQQMTPGTRRLARFVGAAGIAARAAIVAPVGIFLLLAAISAEPRRARGLDAYLAELASTAWGRVLVWTAAGGFAVFALYTLLEVRYRNVHAGD